MEFQYTYRDLGRLSGMAINTVHQDARRGNLDPADLASVVVWLARHGKLALRRRMVFSALSRELASEPKPRRRRT